MTRGSMIDRPPEPYLMGFIMIKAPHFVHFNRQILARIGERVMNLNFQRLVRVGSVREVAFIYLPDDIFRFFKIAVTVSFEMCKTLPVSLVPDPFIIMFKACSLTPGLQAFLSYSS